FWGGDEARSPISDVDIGIRIAPTDCSPIVSSHSSGCPQTSKDQLARMHVQPCWPEIRNDGDFARGPKNLFSLPSEGGGHGGRVFAVGGGRARMRPGDG